MEKQIKQIDEKNEIRIFLRNKPNMIGIGYSNIVVAHCNLVCLFSNFEKLILGQSLEITSTKKKKKTNPNRKLTNLQSL